MNSIWVFIIVVILYSVGLVCAFRAGVMTGVECLLDIFERHPEELDELKGLLSADETDVRGPEGAE